MFKVAKRRIEQDGNDKNNNDTQEQPSLLAKAVDVAMYGSNINVDRFLSVQALWEVFDEWKQSYPGVLVRVKLYRDTDLLNLGGDGGETNNGVRRANWNKELTKTTTPTTTIVT